MKPKRRLPEDRPHRLNRIEQKALYEVICEDPPFKWTETCTRHYDPSGIPPKVVPERNYDEKTSPPPGWDPKIPLRHDGPFADPT